MNNEQTQQEHFDLTELLCCDMLFSWVLWKPLNSIYQILLCEMLEIFCVVTA